MKLFLLVSPTASCSIFMNCFLSSLHFILWDPCLYLWEFCTYGEILNLQTVLCGLSNYFCHQFQFFKYVFSCPVGAFIHSVSLPCFASWSFQNLWAPCFRNALYLLRPHFHADHTAALTEKWRARGRVQMPGALPGGGRECGRGNTLGLGGFRSAQERGSHPVFLPKVPTEWFPTVTTCKSGNNLNIMGQLCG